MPEDIPLELIPSNIDDLNKWIIDYFLTSALNVCERQALHFMDKSPPLKLSVDDFVTQTAVTKASSIPLHWLETIKAELDRDVALGVIEPVPTNTPSTW